MTEMRAAIKQFEEFKKHGYNSNYLPSSKSIELALSLCRKVAEGEPWEVVHAHWVRVDDFTSECSNCGDAEERDPEDDTPYCAQCGSRMDEEEPAT